MTMVQAFRGDQKTNNSIATSSVADEQHQNIRQLKEKLRAYRIALDKCNAFIQAGNPQVVNVELGQERFDTSSELEAPNMKNKVTPSNLDAGRKSSNISG